MNEDWFIALCVALLFLSVGIVAGTTIEQRNWHIETVKRDVAEYDSKTGKWQWKEPAK